jgi:hypothetical protein
VIGPEKPREFRWWKMAILELPIRGKIQRFDLFRFSREVLGYDKLQIDPHLRW